MLISLLSHAELILGQGIVKKTRSYTDELILCYAYLPGNHGEDVKECYYYLDSTPTHSYMKALYKYPQNEYPYGWIVHENQNRSRQEPEFELTDTGKGKTI